MVLCIPIDGKCLDITVPNKMEVRQILVIDPVNNQILLEMKDKKQILICNEITEPLNIDKPCFQCPIPQSGERGYHYNAAWWFWVSDSNYSVAATRCLLFMQALLAMLGNAFSCYIMSECHGEPQVQTNASDGKFAAQNIIDVSAAVALSYVRQHQHNCVVP